MRHFLANDKGPIRLAGKMGNDIFLWLRFISGKEEENGRKIKDCGSGIRRRDKPSGHY